MSTPVRSQEVVSLWRPEQCAEYLGYSVEYLKKLRHLKKGPPWIKMDGGAIRYDPIVVKRWLRGKQHGYEPVHTVGRTMPRVVPGPTLQVRRG